MSEHSSNNDAIDAKTSYPPAVYPPIPSSPVRSSLRSTPHYSTANLREYARDQSIKERKSMNGAAADNVKSSSLDANVETAAVNSSSTQLHQSSNMSNSSTTTKPKQQAPSRIKFCSRDLLVGINLSARESSDNGLQVSGASRGPRLLELWRIDSLRNENENAPTTINEYSRQSLFTMKPIAYSCSNPSFGMSLASTCLEVQPHAPSLNSPGSDMKIATGLTTGALCLHSFTLPETLSSHNDDVHDNPQAPISISMDLFHASPRYHRPATAIAWSPKHSHHVAIGLVGPNHHPGTAGTPTSSDRGGSSSNSQQSVGLRTSVAQTSSLLRPSSATAATGGDRDYCCYLWDIEHQQQQQQQSTQSLSPTLGSSTTAGAPGGRAGGGRGLKSTVPLFKLSYQMGVASLEWVLEDGHTLAVGGQLRNLQLYDVRIGTSQQQFQQTPIMSVYAHNFGVHGIERDPFRPWQFATFCRAANEPVKLWDARMMDTVVSEIKVTGQGNSMTDMNISQNTASITAVQWSATEAGKIAVGVGDVVHEYDTLSSASRSVHVNTTYLEDSVLDFCLYPFSAPVPCNEPITSGHLMAELFPNRLVAVTTDRKVVSAARTTVAPVAISPRDGRIVHSFGRALWIGSPSDGPSAMESLRIQSDEDISSTMMRRARCQHVAKYSMVASSNIKVLAEDGLVAESSLSLPTRAALLRLWSWIERVEALCSEAAVEDLWADGAAWHAKGLIGAGAWRLIHEDHGKEVDVEVFSDNLACLTYDSPGRRAALTSCGWAGKFNLVNVMGECEDLGEYERGAALAVWHGSLEAAVGALERGAEAIRGRLQGRKRADSADVEESLSYAETLELVALCVAGYRGGDNSKFQVAYLRTVLSFLLNLGSDDKHIDILNDASISLCDRVGFACRFLARNQLVVFLDECIRRCQATGDVEGVTVTGLDKDGIIILQSYVDKYADVQTAALVTSRVIFPPDYVQEKLICEEWLDGYRSLLNSWQMWQSRAMFDVDRADLLRQVKAKQGTVSGATKSLTTNTFQGSSSTRNRNAGALRNRKHQGPRPIDPDIQAASAPCQLDARCNYCNSPLGLTSQDVHASQWLSKMKPVLACCPQCRKPLPRCAICLLSLGTLNPYMELTKDRSRSATRGGSVTSTSTGDLSSLGNLPFGEWFSWCMRCKHGGHAHHLVGWFAKHETCPVSGCHCSCQFDGIQKLNRPALLQRSASERSMVIENDDA
ncbi:hypothetical protein MPSEU_000838100 [Mayamaea pseudoterrestris]|nr:hypothetical protein MPSEU_000838100 [Mayamaea pseudoterrestris]